MTDAPSPQSAAPTVGGLLVAETRRRLIDESLPRIRHCLDQLSEDEIWRRPNENVVSVGNLCLHLCGNVRQWMIAGLGGAEDQRDRDSEFTERGPIGRDDLLDRLRNTLDEAIRLLESLDLESLTRTYRVQGFDETGVGIVVHVIEHFSYHTGQISLAVKLLKDIDLGYYAGQDLNAID